MNARPLHDDVHIRQDRLVAALPRLQRLSAALTGSAQAAEELVQLTCEEALSRYPVAPASHDAWLIGSLASAWRSLPRMVGQADGPKDMRQAMAALSPRERLLAALVVVDGTPSRKIARILGAANQEFRETMRSAFARLAEVGGGRWAQELRACYEIELRQPIRPRAIAAARGVTLTARMRPPFIARQVGAFSSWLAVVLALLAVSIAAGMSRPIATATAAQGSAPPAA